MVILLSFRDKELGLDNNSLSSFIRMHEIALIVPLRKHSFRVILNSIDRVVLGFQSSNELLTIIINSSSGNNEEIIKKLLFTKQRGIEAVSMVIEHGSFLLEEPSEVVRHVSEHSASLACGSDHDSVKLSRVLVVINDVWLLM